MSELLNTFKKFSGSELQSFLIEMHKDRAADITPSSLLKSWERDRFVRPCNISPVEFNRIDSAAFEAATDFEPMELSPVCPLGTNSAVAYVSQNKVLGTIRNTEVVADSTNVMSLECAVRRKRLLKLGHTNESLVKLCASHRFIRTQVFNFPGATAHFRVFSLCTAGRDSGNFEFEAKSLADHLSVYLRIFQMLTTKGFKFGDMTLGIYGENERLTSRIINAIQKDTESISIELLGKRNTAYYPTASFILKIKNQKGEDVMIGDGGFTDWTQKLVSNSKERLMISCIGIERLILQFKAKQEGSR